MGAVGASPDRLPDEALLAGLGAGDGALAVAFVRRFQRVVFGVAVAVTADAGTAEDVAQHAFEQAWRHASVYDSRRGSVRAWLTTITHNLAVDVVRARSALPMDPGDLPAMLTAMTDSPERVAVANDSAAEVRGALARLPVTQARAVAMSGIYGMTARQVAETEGIPLGTAKTRIRDGLRKLRSALLASDPGLIGEHGMAGEDGLTSGPGLASEPGRAGEGGHTDETGLPEETGDE
jgi:RNA polymerase sigma factor (sigma-70 family)